MYTANNSLLPCAIQKYFDNKYNVLTAVQPYMYNTRASSKNNLYCKSVKTKLRSFCIRVTGVHLWNDLNENIIKSKTLISFKNELKKMYSNYC